MRDFVVAENYSETHSIFGRFTSPSSKRTGARALTQCNKLTQNSAIKFHVYGKTGWALPTLFNDADIFFGPNNKLWLWFDVRAPMSATITSASQSYTSPRIHHIYWLRDVVCVCHYAWGIPAHFVYVKNVSEHNFDLKVVTISVGKFSYCV